jgi:DNA-binding beta-propeller fold protein YncE
MTTVMILWSCHRKVPDPPGPPLSAPLGIAFSIPHGDISYFNLTTLRTISTQPMGPWAISASVVTRTGNRLAIADAQSYRISVLDLPGLETVTMMLAAGAPRDLAVDNVGTQLYYVTNDGTFWRYSTDTGDLSNVGVGLYPRRLALRPTGETEAWVVTPGESTLRVIDIVHFQVQDSIVFTRPPDAVKFSSDGHLGYVAFEGTRGMVAVYDASTLVQMDSIELGEGPFDICLSHDDGYLAIADSGSGSAYIWNLTTRELREISLGGHPLRITFSRHSNTCYVAEPVSSRVYSIAAEDSGSSPTAYGIMTQRINNLVLWERP